MATYDNPFSKVAAFYLKFERKLHDTKGSDEFWEEAVAMGKYFKSKTEAKMFVLALEELERIWKEKYQ